MERNYPVSATWKEYKKIVYVKHEEEKRKGKGTIFSRIRVCKDENTAKRKNEVHRQGILNHCSGRIRI